MVALAMFLKDPSIYSITCNSTSSSRWCYLNEQEEASFGRSPSLSTYMCHIVLYCDMYTYLQIGDRVHSCRNAPNCIVSLDDHLFQIVWHMYVYNICFRWSPSLNILCSMKLIAWSIWGAREQIRWLLVVRKATRGWKTISFGLKKAWVVIETDSVNSELRDIITDGRSSTSRYVVPFRSAIFGITFCFSVLLFLQCCTCVSTFWLRYVNNLWATL